MGKIPDEVIFGINSQRESINYGHVRTISDDNQLINLLRLRLKVLFIDQVQPLQDSGSAFPLCIMTCIGMETLGEIFIKEDKSDTSHKFVEIARKTHQIFGRKPDIKFEKQLIKIWSEKDLRKIDCYGKILYRFFRNTMIHGYQGKGVFLSYEDTMNIEIDKTSAFIKINPNWFWNSFKDFYEKSFINVGKAHENNTERQNCLKYIKDFLLE